MSALYVPKLSRGELERRRLAAGQDLLKSDRGWGYQARIAAKYHTTTASVARWAAAVDKGGLDALRSTHAKGQRPRLTEPQKDRLRRILVEGAAEHGFATDVWTGKRVASVIKAEFGVVYKAKYVPQFLRDQLGFSWQKPDRRPRELDSAKVRSWLRNVWAPVKKGRSTGAGS